MEKVTLNEDDLNINISAYRILFLLKMFCQFKEVSFVEINHHLFNHPLINRTFTSETLNKYLYTLDLIGCRISRSNSHGNTLYQLEEHPFKFQFTQNEISAVRTVSELFSRKCLTVDYGTYYQLMKKLSRSMLSEDRYPTSMFEFAVESEAVGSYSSVQVEQLRRYCQEEHVIEISYERLPGAVSSILVEPHRLVLDKNQLFLVGYEPRINRKARYDLQKIRSHRQLPSRMRTQVLQTTVTYQLTGRAAKGYRPYPGETLQDKGEFILVKHQTDEIDVLLKRLLKYGPYCRILSPNWVRKEMLAFIDHILVPLEEPLDALKHTLFSTAQTDETLRKWVCYLGIPQTSDDAGDC